VRALGEATATLGPPSSGPSVDPQCLTLLAAACRDHERVRFSYTARDRADTRREVEPHALVNAGRRWYLVAWDCGRDAWRTFRLDRVARPAAGGARFKPRTIPGRDPAAFVKRSLAEATYRYEAHVTLHAPAEEIRSRRWLGGTVQPLGPDRCEFRTSDDHLDWLAMRIAMLGYDFEVHGPPELVDRLRGIQERIARSVGAGSVQTPD
jgi:predicted DNA-binding transcriptional regulator YafY